MLILDSEIIKRPLVKWHKGAPMLKSYQDETPFSSTILNELSAIPEETLKKFRDPFGTEYQKLYANIQNLMTQNFNTPESNIYRANVPLVYLGGYGKAANFRVDGIIHGGSPKNIPSLFSMSQVENLHEGLGLTLTMDWLIDVYEVGGMAGFVDLKRSNRKKAKLYLNNYPQFDVHD